MKREYFALLVVLALCMPIMFGTTTAQDDDEPIKVGLLVDESGPLALYGFEVDNGFHLGMQYATDGTMEINGRPVEIIVRDNASDPDVAASPQALSRKNEV